jgi:hypothetical protein
MADRWGAPGAGSREPGAGSRGVLRWCSSGGVSGSERRNIAAGAEPPWVCWRPACPGGGSMRGRPSMCAAQRGAGAERRACSALVESGRARPRVGRCCAADGRVLRLCASGRVPCTGAQGGSRAGDLAHRTWHTGLGAPGLGTPGDLARLATGAARVRLSSHPCNPRSQLRPSSDPPRGQVGVPRRGVGDEGGGVARREARGPTGGQRP